MSGSFYGAGAQGNQLFLSHGSEVSAYELQVVPKTDDGANLTSATVIVRVFQGRPGIAADYLLRVKAA